MGSGTYSASSYVTYSCSSGKTLDSRGYVTSGQTFDERSVNKLLNAKNCIRECVNTKEHPNTLPVILALDVTGSMGGACKRTAEALGPIVMGLLNKHPNDDIEFMIMGIGDIECDYSPIQASQFESDIRISKAIDKIYIEGGGGGNAYESYSAAWFFGLNRTKLDCYDKQDRKGIIITMGDEPLNPFLDGRLLKEAIGGETTSGKILSKDLYNKAKEKFDIYHIAIDDRESSYSHYASRIDSTFGQLLGENLKISTIEDLPKVIEDCVSKSITSKNAISSVKKEKVINENGEITW